MRVHTQRGRAEGAKVSCGREPVWKLARTGWRKSARGKGSWALDRAAKSHAWYKGETPGTMGIVCAVCQSGYLNSTHHWIYLIASLLLS